MQASTFFSEGDKNVALSCSFKFNTLLASFHAASRAPCSCHSVSSWDRSSNFGTLGLRWWGSPGQIYPSEGFWSRILMWRATAFVNFTRWIGFCMSELFRRVDFGGFMSWKTQTQLSCVRWSTSSRFFVSTHDRCHDSYQVAPISRDFLVTVDNSPSHSSST